jgi:hypothetical protein
VFLITCVTDVLRRRFGSFGNFVYWAVEGAGGESDQWDKQGDKARAIPDWEGEVDCGVHRGNELGISKRGKKIGRKKERG